MPRPSEEPTPEQILDRMESADRRCFVTADVVMILNREWDVSRWTVQDRLLGLAEAGYLDRIKHDNETVNYHLVGRG